MRLHLGGIFRVHTLGVAARYKRKCKDECGLIHEEFNAFCLNRIWPNNGS